MPRGPFSPAFLSLLATCTLEGACAPEPKETESSEDPITFHGARSAVDRTMPEVDAIGYDIEVRVDTSARPERMTASVEGTFVTTTSGLKVVRLDFAGNDVKGVSVEGNPATFRRDGETLAVDLPAAAGLGQPLHIRVEYTGLLHQADGANPNDFDRYGGLMALHRNRAGRTIYSSLNWPEKARRWLPLRDHPRDGAMVSMKLTFPKAFTVIANGERKATTENADGTKTWTYEALTPMPTYDFHLAAYDGWVEAKERSAGAVEVRSYTYAPDRATATAIYSDVPDALDYYAKTFGAYRWGEQVSFLEVPIFGGGMEHATVVSMDETLFAIAESRQTAFHELAHHWSGNLVRIRTWSDFWLSEGMTDYLTRRFLEDHDGAKAAASVWEATRQEALGSDSKHALRPGGDEVDVLSIFDSVSYKKGAFVLRMLERKIGRPQFTAFLKAWFDRFAFKAATTEDFERELSKSSTADLSQFFQAWIHEKGHPEVVATTKRIDARTLEITLDQVQVRDPQDGYPADVDVELRGAGSPVRVTVPMASRKGGARVEASFTPTEIRIDPDCWVLLAPSKQP
jgi:aminopeptidase N